MAEEGSGSLAVRFGRLPLTGQFLLAGGVVMLVALLVTGRWITERIEASVVANTANATALYVDSFVAPLSQDLASDGMLPDAAREALDASFAAAGFRDRIVSIKLWRPDGLVIYASGEAAEGRSLAPPPELATALGGAVVATLEALDDHESSREAALGIPLLEVYSPIRAAGSGRVIAVAEFYEVATELERDLGDARRLSWLLVAAVFAASGLALFGIVRAGSNTIERQDAALRAQVAESRRVAALNRELKERVVRASARATAATERALRRAGADLHDGPAQHVALAAMRLGSIAPGTDAGRKEAAAIRSALDAALAEIRAISRGLSLPDLEGLGLAETIDRAVEANRRHTGAEVSVAFTGPRDTALGFPARTCLYRFLQEALSNAARHAPGAPVEITVATEADAVRVSVRDRGPGFDPDSALGLRPDGGAGLAGLRDRAESLGATFEVAAAAGAGTLLTLTLPRSVP
jgi:signal transduction histidine kinase